VALWIGSGGLVAIGGGGEVWEFMGWLVFEIRQGSTWSECLEVY
jgi:hypothetical protein